ncbi:MAG: hypothetical protein R3C05_03735 [Pirellulaceae bacterium]
MNAHKLNHTHAELFRWLLLWGLASIAIAFFATLAHGQSTEALDRGTRRIPAQIPEGRPIPMPNVDNPDDFVYPYDTLIPGFASASLDQVLQLHHDGNDKEAILAWRTLRMAPESLVWKELGIAVAYKNMGRLEAAVDHLSRALRADDDNAVVEYMLGCVRLMQDKNAPLWYDMNDKSPFRLTGYAGEPDLLGETFLPHFKGSFEKQAEVHFRRAIDLAERVDIHRSIELDGKPEPVIQLAAWRPADDQVITIGDFLVAIGEEDYVGKTHQILGEFATRRSDWQEAEKQFDQASHLGVNVSKPYLEMAKEFEEAGYHQDASRLYLKALRGNPHLSGVLSKAFQNLVDSM